jgi:hypothetical protein
MLCAAGLFTPQAWSMDAVPAETGLARVTMPYSCSIENDDLVLRPGPERAIDILGSREERLFTSCDPPFSNNCRTLTVHRFDVACGTHRIAWQKVVAAIGKTTAGDATMSKGHMVLVREAEKAAGHAYSCTDGKAAAANGGECLPWRVKKPIEKLILPQGFAPVREVGARILEGPAPSEYAATDVMSLGASSYTAEPLAKPAAGGAAGPMPVASTNDAEPVLNGGWSTSLSVYRGEEPPPELIVASADPISPPVATAEVMSIPSWLTWFAAFGGLALAAAYLYRMQQLRVASPMLDDFSAGARRGVQRVQGFARDAAGTVRARMVPAKAADPGPAEVVDPALASALLQLKAMLSRTEAAVSMLSSAAVLREVMQTDLAAARERLTEVETAVQRGTIPLMKLAAQLRQIAREIERVQRITESAAHSFSQHAASIRVPTTVAEAYAVIGVDADDGDAVAQRVIESMRMSSRPDFASDETDRRDRLARIRQIDVASDLIARRLRPG